MSKACFQQLLWLLQGQQEAKVKEHGSTNVKDAEIYQEIYMEEVTNSFPAALEQGMQPSFAPLGSSCSQQ